MNSNLVYRKNKRPLEQAFAVGLSSDRWLLRDPQGMQLGWELSRLTGELELVVALVPLWLLKLPTEGKGGLEAGSLGSRDYCASSRL